MQIRGTKRTAGWFLVVVAFVFVIVLFSGAGAFAVHPRSGHPGDVATYKLMIDDVRVHHSYYDAVGTRLRSGNYATSEVFNWRTPLLMSALALAPLGVA